MIFGTFFLVSTACFGFASSIKGGNRVQKGEWPWKVAFFYQPEEKYICGGSLISDKHVLSGKNILQKISSVNK
jgi:secreted trypsin-like serine protease